MKRFLKIYLITVVIFFICTSLGALSLFDFSVNFYIAILAYAFIIAITITSLLSMSDKIRNLEARIKKLESQGSVHSC